MGKRGPKPKHLISEKWTPNLAYAIGLLASDGCLSPPGHLINLTSNDREQLENFSKCLGVEFKIGSKSLGFLGKRTLRVQLKNVLFYNFLFSIGLTPAKSKTIGKIKVPQKYFFDFLRGVFDGDGSTYSHWDKRWKSSFMFYVGFASASPSFIRWLQKTLEETLCIAGHITSAKGHTTSQLKYAKREGLKILRKMYHSPKVVCLSRKRLKIMKMLDIVGERL